jgi:hypothetical protein
MRSPVLAGLLLLGLGVLLAGCQCDGGASCTYDVDCPGAQVCIEGVCRDWEPPDPCETVVCDPGDICINGECVDHTPDPCEYVECEPDQLCVDGHCIDQTQDADGDGFPVTEDCDDNNAAVNPDAAEICNQIDDDCDGDTDEDNVCGQECDQVNVPPGDQAPFACDSTTLCERCARYQDLNYHCRSRNGGPYVFLAIPDETPCDLDHHCDTLECAGEFEHCDGVAGEFQGDPIPTADEEVCNGIDDNCDGQTDGAGSEASCAPRENAAAACTDGGCTYTCNAGYHDCSGTCLSDTSVDSCGTLCTPCPEPANAQASCTNGACDFTCNSGYYRENDVCATCNVDAHCGPDCRTCGGSLTCCTDACYDLVTDPEHCGACNQYCPTIDYSCCSGLGCCAPEHPICCPGNFCCTPGGTCCPDGCCAAEHPLCCGAGCCETGTTCCNNQFCCPADYPICCPTGCCPAGTYCCGDQCCLR